jgi:ketosteroid isomerase-like protein
MQAEIVQMEERLRAAMLASNVAELDALIDDRLLFVVPNGDLYRKADDLAFHQSGETTFSQIELADIQIELYGETAVVVVLANLAGTFKGDAFAGHSRYTRTWIRSAQGWRIVSGSVCSVAESEC